MIRTPGRKAKQFLFAALMLCAIIALTAPSSFAKSLSGGGMRQTLTVLTYNLWHGLNPIGLWKFQEYQTPEEREVRLQGFLKNARKLDPDIIFVQEVNPTPGLSKRIAKELGMDRVFKVDNAGLKIGSFGLPTNFRSGLAILAKKDLQLKGLGSKKLSGTFGRSSQSVSIQWGEFRYVHAAKVQINGKPMLLLNTHLHHGIEVTPEIVKLIDKLVTDGKTEPAMVDVVLEAGRGAAKRRDSELKNVIEFAKPFGYETIPILFAGDFNASPWSGNMVWLKSEMGFSSTTGDDDKKTVMYTWNPARNPHTLLAAKFKPSNEYEQFLKDYLVDQVIGTQRRLDYIYYKNMAGAFEVTDSGLFADSMHEGQMSSDHFGIWAKMKAVLAP